MEESVSQEAQTEGSTETSEAPTITYGGGKFQSAGDLDNAYLELQSTFSKKLGAFTGAPEAYTFEAEGFEENDLSSFITEFGLNNQVSNEKANELYQGLSELESKRAEQFEQQQAEYIKEQTELLGTNAEARIKNVTDWVNANGGDGASDKLNLMAAGAEGLAIIENIMKRSQSAGTPANVPASEGVTLEKVNEMQFAKDQYGNLKMDNPEYAAKVRAMRASLQR